MNVVIKRVYEQALPSDGFRILIDRLWPRGLSKARADLDIWLKDIAPSTELRKWFNHDPEKWPEFKRKYKQELKNHKDALQLLKHLIKEKKKVTLLYAAHDENYNNAIVLQSLIKRWR